MRPDREGAHRALLAKNKKIIKATQDTCGICGKPVDKTLPAGDPMSAVIDHIVPVGKHGHPSDLSNLQLAHWTCNRQKADKLYKNMEKKMPQIIGNRNLPQTVDWQKYKADGQ